MSKLSEITSLFTIFASNLQTLDSAARNEDDQDLSITISNLNRSLNLSETHPSVRILDTALSLMCFTAPQVFESLIEYTVKTIVAVLSSSIECKILRVGKKEVLRVGGSISTQDCAEVIHACVDVLEKLEGHGGDLSPSVLYAVVRVAVLASRFQHALELTTILDVKPIDGSKLSLAKLLCRVPKELGARGGEMPVRLLLWYLDSAILKHDMSQILQEANRRPFLCLSIEFHERTEWRSIIVCLALAPAMFVEARARLHNWFLVTGLASVLKLEIELVSMVLDIVSRPMWWGLSMEIASKLPFSHAYFPYKHQLLKTFAGPLTWANFQHLVHKISRLEPGKCYHTSSAQAPVRIELVDHKSPWAAAMNFPQWFFFASVLLFSTPSFQGGSNAQYMIGYSETDQLIKEEQPYSAAAARFIAWILNPISGSHQDLLVDYLTKITASWDLQQFTSDKSNEVSSGYKEVREHSSDYQENRAFLKYNGHAIWVWLKDFQDMCVRYCKRVVANLASFESQTSQADGSQHNRLFRRVPLGILIGFFDFIDEVGCELLLHYGATGTLFEFLGTQDTRGLPRRQNGECQEVSIQWSDTYTPEEAVAGVNVIFELTDVIENMSTCFFETEERALNFVCSMKLKVGKYLLKCAKRLLQLKTDEEDRLLLLRDLCSGIVRWRHQGRDVFENYKDMDDVIDALSCLSG